MEMRTGSLLSVAACGGAMIITAQAADLSTKPPTTKAPPAAYIPQAINWTGFYIGAHLGGAWSNANWTNPVSGLTDNLRNGGVFGGAQMGVNYQFDSIVLGVEGDFSGTSLKPSGTDAAGFMHSTGTYWTSTVTGRLGYAINQALFFAKGGVAFADERDTVTSPLGVLSSTGTTTQVGWTAGGGLEYALDRNWSAKIEYDYLGFGSRSVPATALVGAPGSVDLNIQRAMAGVNYRF
jgi:outer membrane immunogenic protein